MKFKIPVVWMVRGVVEIDAPDVERAMIIALGGVEFPSECEYIDDTMELDCFDPKVVAEQFNTMKG